MITWKDITNLRIFKEIRLERNAVIKIKQSDNTLKTISMSELGALDGVTATAAEINRAVDVSGRLVAAGSTLALTEAAHDGKTILLDTAAGSAITLPAATGSGTRFRFVVTVKPTTNQHRISVVGNDAMLGSVNLLDLDGAAQTAYAAAADSDQFNLNGTTTGGQIGDVVELEDALADRWLVVRGQLTCAAGSNPATPFATAQVT